MSIQYDVCVITTIHPDFDKRVYRQVCGLLDAGFKVCVVAPWNFSKRDRFDYDFIQLDPAKTRPDRVVHGRRVYRAARSVAALTYIFHDPDFLPFALRLKRDTGRPVIYDSHENFPEEIEYGKAWLAKPLRRPLALLSRAYENFAVRRLGHAITTVPNLTRRFKALGADAVEVRNYPRVKAPERRQREQGVIYSGTVSADFGAESLLQIAAEMRNCEVDLPLRVVDLFQGDERFRAEFLRRIKLDSLPIEMIPPVPAHEIGRVLDRGHIGLSPVVDIPNRALALPTKIFEFYQFELAVIASDVEGSRIATENGELGVLVPHDDFRAWALAIKRLHEDKAMWQRLTSRAREASDSRYTWSLEQAKLNDYIARVSARGLAKAA